MAGFVLWFTGLSGSGKSTLTTLVATELRRRGVHVETLDGDEIRKNLSKGLGFSKEDRDANVRRLGFVARLVARSGGCAITAAISPYREIRDEVRAGVERFCEVYCECPVAVLAKRDPKGLYDKAMRGEIKNFTGVDDPYEAPLQADVHLYTDNEKPEVSANRILERLLALGFIEQSASTSSHALPPPYGAELQQRLSTASAQTSDCELALAGDAELSLVGLATGLLSPLSGFMSSREAIKVRRESHLERGLPWPTPVLLEIADARSVSGRLALVSATDGQLGALDLHETWQDENGKRFAAGDVVVHRLPPWAAACRTAESVRSELEARGTSVALPLFDLPNIGDEHLARAALELGQHLLLMPVLTPQGTAPLVEACQALVRHYLDPAKVSVVPVPAPPGAEPARLLAIYAQNLGATRLLLPERLAPLASLPAYGAAIHFYARPYFDERINAVVSTRAPSSEPPGAESLKRAEARRPEIAAFDRATT